MPRAGLFGPHSRNTLPAAACGARARHSGFGQKTGRRVPLAARKKTGGVSSASLKRELPVSSEVYTDIYIRSDTPIFCTPDRLVKTDTRADCAFFAMTDIFPQGIDI